MAQAPSCTASAASSRLVIPQIFTRTTLRVRDPRASPRAGPVRWLGLFGLCRTYPESDRHVLRFVVAAEDGQFHLVARLGGVDHVDDFFHRANGLAFDFGDDVATEPHRRAFDRRFGVAAFKTRLVGRAVLDD